MCRTFGFGIKAGHTQHVSIGLRLLVRTCPSSSINLYTVHLKLQAVQYPGVQASRTGFNSVSMCHTGIITPPSPMKVWVNHMEKLGQLGSKPLPDQSWTSNGFGSRFYPPHFTHVMILLFFLCFPLFFFCAPFCCCHYTPLHSQPTIHQFFCILSIAVVHHASQLCCVDSHDLIAYMKCIWHMMHTDTIEMYPTSTYPMILHYL